MIRDPEEITRRSRLFLAEKNSRLEDIAAHQQAQEERRRANAMARHQRVLAQLKSAGVNPDLLKRQGVELRAGLDEYRRHVRPGLIGRGSHLEHDLGRAGELLELEIPGLDLIQASPLGVQTIPVTQNLPGEIRFSLDDTGEGSGWDIWQSYPYGIVTFWFHIVPTRTAIWTLQALTQLRGFYVLRAEDEAWTSKVSWFDITTQLSVVQHAWTYGNWIEVLHKGDDNIDETGFIDQLSQLQMQVPLQAGDLAVVYVDVRVETQATGDGSYSEVNSRTAWPTTSSRWRCWRGRRVRRSLSLPSVRYPPNLWLKRLSNLPAPGSPDRKGGRSRKAGATRGSSTAQ